MKILSPSPYPFFAQFNLISKKSRSKCLPRLSPFPPGAQSAWGVMKAKKSTKTTPRSPPVSNGSPHIRFVNGHMLISTWSGPVPAERKRKALLSQQQDVVKPVRCVLMDEQIFLNFRGKEDCTVFLVCFNCIFFLLLMLLVFLQLTERYLQFLLRGQRNDNYIHSFWVLKYQGKDYLSKSVQSRRVFFLTK